MKDILTYVNFSLLLVILIGGMVFYSNSDGFNYDEIETEIDLKEPTDETVYDNAVRTLQEKNKEFEARLNRLESLRSKEEEAVANSSTEKNFHAQDARSQPDMEGAAKSEIPAVTKLSEEMKEVIKEFLREERGSAPQKNRKPKKKISEVAKELGLDSGQEQQLVDLHTEMTNEIMKILFDVEDYEGLEEVKQQLKDVEYNPELKEKLGEKIGINFHLSKDKFAAIGIKMWMKAKKFLSEEQFQALDKYDLQSDRPEWPDIGKMFFPEKKEGDSE